MPERDKTMNQYLRILLAISMFIIQGCASNSRGVADFLSAQQVQSMTHRDISQLKTFQLMPDTIRGTKEYGVYAKYSVYAREALIRSGLKEYQYIEGNGKIPDQIVYLHFEMKKGDFSTSPVETNCYNDQSGNFSCLSTGGTTRNKYTFGVEFTAYDITEWISGNLDGPIAWRSQSFLIVVSPLLGPDTIFSQMLHNTINYLHTDTKGYVEIESPLARN